MQKAKIAQVSLAHSLGVMVYVAIVAAVMSRGERLFEKVDNPVLAGVAMLMLFSTSAVVVCSLVLGRPLMLYLDGKKKEAVTFLISTIGWLVLLTIAIWIYLGIN